MKAEWKAFFIFLLFIIAPACNCQKSEISISKKEAQEKLHSDDWNTRKEGVNLLISLQDKGSSLLDENVAPVLLHILEDEIKRKKDFMKRGIAEGKSSEIMEKEFDRQYPRPIYGDFLATISILLAKGRPSGSLPVVFQFLVETDYVVSPVLPTLYGEEGLQYLLQKVYEGQSEEKKTAVQILSLWVNPPLEAEDWDPTIIPKLTQRQKDKIFPFLMKALEMDDSYSVYCATTALEAFLEKPGVREKLMELVKYPDTEVHNEAKRILQNKKPEGE